MPVGQDFEKAAAIPARPKRPAPFSIRLSHDERNRLVAEADGIPLGAYIKAKALGPTSRRAFAVHDRTALGQVLAQLGKSRLANNLNQLAHAANIGTLPITPETEDDLRGAIIAVREMRDLLVRALGLQAERGP